MAFDPTLGLSAAQYSQNVGTFGLNKLPEVKPPRKIEVFLAQFKSPLIYILGFAGIVTLLLGDVIEAIGIGMVVVINSVLGFFQENKAEATLASLKGTIRPHTTVVRSGREEKILNEQLTIGDVVILKLGDKIPSDGLLVEGSGLSANEAVLTGESEAVEKHPIDPSFLTEVKSNGFIDVKKLSHLNSQNTLYMGTAVMSGAGKMLVTQIGLNTKFGQIAGSIFGEREPLTPLQLRLGKLSKMLTVVVLLISIFILIWGLLQSYEIVEILELAISVAVSAIPEGLVVALTVILALGMSRILKRRAIVRKLVAAETLGSVDTICIDKTGTLTEGRMSVVQTFFANEKLAKRALLATNHQVNAVEVSLLNWLENRVTTTERDEFAQERLLEHKIFDSLSKFSATLGADNMYVVGAPELILEKSTLSPEEKETWSKELREFSQKGMRLVALAFTQSSGLQLPKLELPDGLTWLGLVVLEDPVRDNLHHVFTQARRAGIDIKVITGDFGETAQAVLHKIGINIKEHEMMSGQELAGLSNGDLKSRISDIKLFYRTSPDQKFDIVKALQEQGHVIAMMGDGINDTPALKRAEIGIVVNNATDFSKEVADIILLDSNFQTIIAAVEEGRNIFENMRKVITYLLVDAFDALLIVIGALLMGLPTPLLPLQILYINFLADGLPDLALAFEEPEHELMKDNPRPKDSPLIDNEVKSMVVTIGVVVATAVLGVFIILLNQGYNIDFIRTFIFSAVGMNSLFFIFSIRTFRKNIWHQQLFTNKFLNLGVLGGVLAMLAAVYLPPLQHLLATVPLPLWAWGIIAIKVIIDISLIEIIKYYFIAKPR